MIRKGAYVKRKEGYGCPLCRATNCRYNEHDTCLRYIPGREPGFDCPDFNRPVGKKEGIDFLMEMGVVEISRTSAV